MQLRKCCNHPYLFEGVEDKTLDPFGDHLVTNSGKMRGARQAPAAAAGGRPRVLIFSQMTRMLDILEDYCYRQLPPGRSRRALLPHRRLDGVRRPSAQEAIDAFNASNSTGSSSSSSRRARAASASASAQTTPTSTRCSRAARTKTAEMAAKLKADCQHSLETFDLDAGGDPSKLYQLDGVEYDSKGVRDLIEKLQGGVGRQGRRRRRRRRGGDGGGGTGDAKDALLLELLTSNWALLRTAQGVPRAGQPGTWDTMEKMRDAAARRDRRPQKGERGQGHADAAGERHELLGGLLHRR